MINGFAFNHAKSLQIYFFYVKCQAKNDFPNDIERREVGLFVCVEVLRPTQPNGVMLSAVSLPNHTFTGQAKSSKRFTSIVHILSPETDNCPS